jgi:hypothetical protein
VNAREVAVKREAVLLAIEAHGPEVLFDHVATVRSLYRKAPAAFHSIVEAAVSAGMPRRAVMDSVFNRRVHGRECACWECIFRLQASIIRAAAKRAAKSAMVLRA